VSWRGRKKLGDEIFLAVQCRNGSNTPTAPDAAPLMTVYNESGTKIISKAIPPIDRYTATGLFGIMLPLNSVWSAGRYAVYYNYLIAATQFSGSDNFEITAGGDAAGQVISLFYLDRPDVDWLVYQTDMGNTTINRNPHI
jgi:hypothetical protein